MPEDERNRRFHQLVCQDAWIIEGIYVSWIKESLQQADYIVLLEIPLSSCRWRIIKRFLKRKIRREDGKRETLRTLAKLLRWMKHDYPSKQKCFARIEKQFPAKTICLRTTQKISQMLVEMGNDS